MGGRKGVSKVPMAEVIRNNMIREIRSHAVAARFSDEFLGKVLDHCDKVVDVVVARLKLIQQIKEMAGNHADDDVYGVLVDFNFDINEAAQRLLYIDTFHEVKKKKKVIVPSRRYVESRWVPANQWRGTGGHGNNSSSSVSNGLDVVSVRNASSRKEISATDRVERVAWSSKQNVPATDNHRTSHAVSGAEVVPNRISGDGIAPQTFEGSSLSKSSSSASAMSRVSNSSQLPSKFTNKSLPGKFNHESIPSEQLNDKASHSQSILGKEKLQSKLENRTPRPSQPIIYPENLLVPEVLNTGLTFGTVNSTPMDGGPKHVSESVEGSASSDCAEGSKREVKSVTVSIEASNHVVESIEGFKTVAEAVEDTSDSVNDASPRQGSPSVTVEEVTEPEAGVEDEDTQDLSVSAPTPPNQHIKVAKNTPFLAPPLFPYYQHPYLPSYVAYGPYLPHFYNPQGAHQLMGLNGVLQHPSGNLYPVQSDVAGATIGAKPPGLTSFKQPINSGNSVQFGIPSGYPSPVSYNAAVMQNSAAGDNNPTVSLTTEKVAESPVKKGGDEQVKAPGHSREMISLPPSFYYNYYQGHNLQALPGLYYASHPMAAQPLQPLPHPSQSMVIPVESQVPPSSTPLQSPRFSLSRRQ